MSRSKVCMSHGIVCVSRDPCESNESCRLLLLLLLLRVRARVSEKAATHFARRSYAYGFRKRNKMECVSATVARQFFSSHFCQYHTILFRMSFAFAVEVAETELPSSLDSSQPNRVIYIAHHHILLEIHIFSIFSLRTFSPRHHRRPRLFGVFTSASSPASYYSSRWQSEWQRNWGDTQCQWDIAIKSYFVVRSHIHILIFGGCGRDGRGPIARVTAV